MVTERDFCYAQVMSDKTLDHANRVTWARLNIEEYHRIVAQYRGKEIPVISFAVYPHEDAVSILEDYGYSYNFSLNALYIAYLHGEWKNVRRTIKIEYRDVDMYAISVNDGN